MSDASVEALTEALAGVVGAVIATTATYPLSIVVLIKALEHKKEPDPQEEAVAKKYQQLPTPFKELFLYWETKGWKSLFTGLKPNLFATAISQGVYFYLYSALRQGIVEYQYRKAGGKGSPGSGRTADIGVLGSTIVAGLAGCANVLITNPVWVVASQMQAAVRSKDPEVLRRGFLQWTTQVYRENGLKGFFKGLIPSLVMVVNPTIQYIMYEWLTARLMELRLKLATTAGRKPDRLTPHDVFVLTALAKIGATVLTYPMLLIKNRLQSQNAATDSAMQYKGVGDAVLRIIATEGYGGFFKGIQSKMLQTVLGAALLMSIKEQVYLSTRMVLSRAR